MAELIITPEERATKSYLDWDDAALGRAVKLFATKIEKSQDVDGFSRTLTMSAGLLLIRMARDCNGATLELELDGCTSYGIETGDWKITVERTRAPEGDGNV